MQVQDPGKSIRVGEGLGRVPGAGIPGLAWGVEWGDEFGGGVEWRDEFLAGEW